MRDRNWFPAFSLGMAATAAVALLLPKEPVVDEFWESKVIAAPQELSDLVDVSEWKWTERTPIPGQTGMTVQYFQDVANGTCYARFTGYVEGVTWIPCEATDR